MVKLVFLTLGGITGTFARYFLSGFVYQIAGVGFPYGTLAVNLIGCFLVGLFSTLANERFLCGPDTKVLLIAGFCGSFTTFSTFMLETANLIKEGEIMRAFLNALGSVILGFIVFRLGVLMGEVL